MNATARAALTAVVLLALLALTVTAAYVKLGPLNPLLSMGIALIKAALIVTVFMKISKAGTLQRLFACAGIFWLGIMITLAMTDYLTRP